MPATNYTPIQLYRSTTSGNLPLAANLSPGELALNIADNDMTMYMENASGVVKSFFNNPAALKYPTADGTSGQIIQTNGAGVLSFGSAPSSALTNNTRQAVTSSATTTINLNSGNVIDLTMAANITTLSFTNVPASGTPILIQIVVRNASDGTAYTIVWPNSVYWSGQYSATTLFTNQTAPTLATGANGVTVIALLTTDGGTKWRGWVDATIAGGTANSLYTWGQNGQGQLGDNSTANTTSPNVVGALINWSNVVTTGYTASGAIKTDGTLWTWGGNNSGELGDSTVVSKSSPIQIGFATDWAKITNTGQSFFAIKTTGTLWAWGNNGSGRLGINVSPAGGNNRSSPTQIGLLSDWSDVGGYTNGAGAIKTNGTMWAWGYNGQGQIGDSSNVASRSSPVQIGALTNWAQVVIGGALRPSFAINTTGELYAWGPFNYGQRLFVGSGGANTSSPTQVGAGVSGWTQIGTGQNFAGIKDGNVFAAGRGVQVGPGPTSSPVQITSSGDWAGVAPLSSGTSFNTVALKTNGTLWSFTNSSSPTQVGTASDWSFTNNRLNKMYPPGNAGYTSGTKIFIRTFISNPA